MTKCCTRTERVVFHLDHYIKRGIKHAIDCINGPTFCVSTSARYATINPQPLMYCQHMVVELEQYAATLQIDHTLTVSRIHVCAHTGVVIPKYITAAIDSYNSYVAVIKALLKDLVTSVSIAISRDVMAMTATTESTDAIVKDAVNRYLDIARLMVQPDMSTMRPLLTRLPELVRVIPNARV